MFDLDSSGMPMSAEDCYNDFANRFGYTFGFFHGGAAPFSAGFTPFDAFINLKTGILVEKDTTTSYIETPEEAISLMQQAAQ